MMMLFLSLDAIRLLSRAYEFWFMTALSTLHWVCVALILRDARMLVSFASWLGLQTVIMVDANFRTFPAATRFIIVSTPSLAAIGVCCALKEIQGGHFAPISLGQLEIFLADIVVFTTSTLVTFMGRKRTSSGRGCTQRSQDGAAFPASGFARHSSTPLCIKCPSNGNSDNRINQADSAAAV